MIPFKSVFFIRTVPYDCLAAFLLPPAPYKRKTTTPSSVFSKYDTRITKVSEEDVVGQVLTTRRNANEKSKRAVFYDGNGRLLVNGPGKRNVLIRERKRIKRPIKIPNNKSPSKITPRFVNCLVLKSNKRAGDFH